MQYTAPMSQRGARYSKLAAGRFSWHAAAIGAAAVGLMACGSSGPATSPVTKAAGAATTSASAGAATNGASSGLDLSKLGSFTSYTGTMTDNGEVISVRVHSPADWQETLGKTPPSLYIDGSAYGRSLNAQGQPVWYRNTAPPQVYEQSPYPGAAQQFAGMTKVYGVTVVRGAPCTVAGVSGHTWTIKSRSSGMLAEGESACVADQSGALLSLNTSASGSDVPASGLSYSYTMTSVGGVPSIPVPSPVQAG